MDMDDLARSLGEGWIRVQKHPQHPLFIYNYTERAVFTQSWNTATLACRGLITNQHDVVIARPFPKFFNHGEAADPYKHEAARGYLPMIITDKLDGSLGILYYTPDGQRAVATRGSFTSDQALWATEKLNTFDWNWAAGYTPLVEIIYPENRIVLDYGNREALVLIGAVERCSGKTCTPLQAQIILNWPGEVAERLDAIQLDRENREGVVVHYLKSDTRVKFKQEDYIQLHKLVTNLNARTVYDALGKGQMKQSLEAFCAPFPDEVHEWILDVALELWWMVEDHVSVAYNLYDEVVGTLNESKPGWDRGDFARLVQSEYPRVSGPLFFLLDERYDRLDQWAWDASKPAADAFGKPRAGGIKR